MRTLACLAVAAAALAVGPAAGAADPPAKMRAIVHAWSVRLNANDNKGVAELFAVPATIAQGPYVYRLTSRTLIALWHSTLPCAGRVVSVSVTGRFATAVFRLANRGSTPCDAPGSLAAARFEIRSGKIVTWTQVPVPKRSSGTTTA